MTIHDTTSDRRTANLIRDALLKELRREAEDADGQMTERLQLIARKLVDKAEDGDIAAIKEVIDRTDGRTPIATRGEERPRTVTFEWKSSGECG